mmetsp:Transcript_8741/g.19614  ORF Transcript_8741/g.19614 Transcript_8741/m.19614 type:complete len:207 (-) Transcript_8741:518-1138(-)
MSGCIVIFVHTFRASWAMNHGTTIASCARHQRIVFFSLLTAIKATLSEFASYWLRCWSLLLEMLLVTQFVLFLSFRVNSTLGTFRTKPWIVVVVQTILTRAWRNTSWVKHMRTSVATNHFSNSEANLAVEEVAVVSKILFWHLSSRGCDCILSIQYSRMHIKKNSLFRRQNRAWLGMGLFAELRCWWSIRISLCSFFRLSLYDGGR